MVDKERVRLLVDALRSGKYIQGQGSLELLNGGGLPTQNCCLGVACRVAIANGLDVTVTRNTNEYGTGTVSFNDQGGYLPVEVGGWYGFTLFAGNVMFPADKVGGKDEPDYPGERFSATYLNDTLSFNFSQIADVFERTFLDV